jgi:hypothetical protein
MKLELLTNTTVVDDAIRYVNDHKKTINLTKISTLTEDDKANNTKEGSIATTNYVF